MNKLVVNPKTVLRFLMMTAAALIALGIAVQLVKHGESNPFSSRFARLFSLNGERNVPTLFSVFLLLLAASLLAFIATLKKKSHDPYALKWTVLSAGFIIMAIDEAWSFHESLGPPIRALLA